MADKPNNKNPVVTSVLSGLCVGVVVTALPLVGCSPTYAGFKPLQGNDISLQGNGNTTVNDSNKINIDLPIALYKDKGYYEVLLKNNSGRADRSNLAFYVNDSNVSPQTYFTKSDTTHARYKRRWGSSTPMFMVAEGNAPTLYEGKTSLNKKAFGRISGAVAIVAESDSSHPIFTYSVIPTQKTIGAIHHG